MAAKFKDLSFSQDCYGSPILLNPLNPNTLKKLNQKIKADINNEIQVQGKTGGKPTIVKITAEHKSQKPVKVAKGAPM